MHRSFRGVASGAVALFAGILALAPARADTQPYVMKITLPTINEQTHQYAKNLAARVAADSSGRIKAEVYPASQLGSIPRQIEGTQFGSIQCAVIPPEFFVGVDERFQVMAAPGLVTSMEEARRLSIDPAVHAMMLSLGAAKGLHGAALFVATPSDVVSRAPIRHLDEFKGKKLRVLASDFQTSAFARLGATTVAMSLGDVLPAIQQGAIDGALSSLTVFTSMQYQDAAKYVTTIGQPYIFIAVEFSTRWRASLPPDLQELIDKDAADEAVKIFPVAVGYVDDARNQWTGKGGELISLPPDERSAMMESMGSVAGDVAKKNADLAAAYQTVADAAKRIRSGAN